MKIQSRAKRWILLLFLTLIVTPVLAGNRFISLCYHDIRAGKTGTSSRTDGLTIDRFITQLEWLKGHGYKFVSFETIVQAEMGKCDLPSKSVLITFDDGLKSLYSRVYPLLRAYGIPIVAAIEGQWMDVHANRMVHYGSIEKSRDEFLSWIELKEMVDSGLVEVASHTFDLHKGVLGNPQGNTQPATTTHIYDRKTGLYENDATLLKRVAVDLERNNRLLKRHLGITPRIIVWPYGEHSVLADQIASGLGMPYSLSLTAGINNTDSLLRIHRFLIGDDLSLSDFIRRIEGEGRDGPIRAAQIDLDYIYDPNPRQIKRNLDLLLERVKAMGVNTVYLQAYADPDGDGTASALYFPNRHLPVRADIFNRISWQLRTRCGVRVYAWLPVLSYELPDKDLNQELLLKPSKSGLKRFIGPIPRRLSPYNPMARSIIGDIYEDLARATPIYGLFFHDDGILGIGEGPDDKEKDLLLRARERGEFLCEFTRELTHRAEKWRTPLKTTRNIFSRVVLEPESELRFGQNLNIFLTTYDRVALMTMPYLEKSKKPLAWIEELFKIVKETPESLEKVVFEIQTFDWARKRPVSTRKLMKQVRLLRRLGAHHIAYYPDDLHKDHPRLKEFRKAISSRSYPFWGL